ncbi:MAG TPA: chromosome segregation protein SMC [Planctomycetota bacterium]|nr:chromosome segregation protein SMC [Planctomycetota bacterium]
MQLKKLEMCGFKSFANRTEILFDKGVTGIVGPNGCGKSNVVDAIKWVLGTLSYKSVRGEEMLDVIFKGAEGVPPMGFAEVSLTLDNSDHTLPLEFEEVTITRRLFSTGEGEYFINKAPCRLKDIRELLYGTGIGTDNYSVIEQGKIDKLVLSNPHERRLVFDEAAGISKYRARKRETEHRLEKVSQDLLRIQDVVHEVQKQLRSVRAQAGRAARYKELTEELKSKRLRLYVHEHRRLAAARGELAERLRAVSERREALRAELGARAAAAEEVRRRLEAESARHAELASAVAGLESQAAYLERSLESARARERELAAERGRAEAEREALEAKALELAEQVEAESRALAEFDRAARERAAEAEELTRRMEDAARECARAQEELEAKRAEALELAHKEAQYRNERERLERERSELGARAGRLKEEAGRLEAERAELRARLEQARAEAAALEREIAERAERKRAEEEELGRLREEVAQLERELLQLREGKDHRVARRETLRDLEAHFEGLEAGAKALLRERRPGVLGSVADFLEVAPEHVAAVEGALGERAGAVVVDTAEHAEEAAAFVRERGLGRTILIALDECRNGYFSDVELLATGALGRASSWVRTEPAYRGMVDALLGHTLVVRDRAAAREIRRDGLTEWPLVTPEGDLFDHPGMTTVAGARAAGSGLLSRKAELRTLEEEIERYLALITEREGRREEAGRRLKETEERIERLRHEAYEKSVALREAAARAEQTAMREEFLGEELRARAAESEAIGRQAAAVADRAASLETLLAELAWVKSQVEAEIAGLGRTLEGYEASRAELQDALTQARVECAKASEQRLGVEKRLEFLEARRGEVARALERARALAEEVGGRLEGAREEIGRHEAERGALAARVEEARRRADEAAAAREALAREGEEARAAVARAEEELAPCEEELGRLRVDEEGARVKADALADRAREELGMELAQAAEAVPAEEGIDGEALAREVEELRVKIGGFGAVNVVALEQLSELEEREKFLLTQTEDLVRSKTQLEDLIRQLNKESRELFDKTFDFVKEQFNTIFRKIFGGGKADLVLEQAEGVDPMEQGLEILARPPGKEQTPISLLSGGERSLTAIALVLALFKANPSPFCLLDEADAALDEKNVERYAGVVREFASETQFIVITHNKRTMAVCDALYGITMEQQGVSKKVSVSLSGDAGLELLKPRPEVPAGTA